MCTLQRHQRYDLSSDVGGVKGVRRVIRTSEDCEKDIQNATNSSRKTEKGSRKTESTVGHLDTDRCLPLTSITMQLI